MLLSIQPTEGVEASVWLDSGLNNECWSRASTVTCASRSMTLQQAQPLAAI